MRQARRSRTLSAPIGGVLLSHLKHYKQHSFSIPNDVHNASESGKSGNVPIQFSTH